MRLPKCTMVSGQIDLNTGGARIKVYPLDGLQVDAKRPR
jgi:hypothetical protein